MGSVRASQNAGDASVFSLCVWWGDELHSVAVRLWSLSTELHLRCTKSCTTEQHESAKVLYSQNASDQLGHFRGFEVKKKEKKKKYQMSKYSEIFLASCRVVVIWWQILWDSINLYSFNWLIWLVINVPSALSVSWLIVWSIKCPEKSSPCWCL